MYTLHHMMEFEKVTDMRNASELQLRGLLGRDTEWMVTLFGSEVKREEAEKSEPLDPKVKKEQELRESITKKELK